MPLTLKTKTRSGYLIAFLLLLTSYFLIFYIVQKLVRGTRDVSHSYAIINELGALRSDIVDAETGVRGYIITRHVNFLSPYYSALRNIPTRFESLGSLAVKEREQAERLDTLRRLISRKLGFLSHAISSFRETGFSITVQIVQERERGRVTMDSIRLYINQVKAYEEQRMLERTGNLTGFFNSTNIIAITSLLIAVMTIVFSLFTYNRENRARELADLKAKNYQAELENTVQELKRVNTELQELRQIEKFAATGRIARTIAHEVRNPLTNITLAAEQLQEHAREEDSSVLLDMIRRNACRIDELVADLLQSTRFAQLEFTTMDVNQLLDETLELALDRIGLNHVRVEKIYTRNTCQLTIDREKMKLALLNIIVNAVEAMENQQGGVLTLKTSKDGNKCVIEIGDNGPGMDDETLQKIFEPYYTSKIKGNGLGLTHSQNIIFNHQGKIQVSSYPGKGTWFTVHLQVA